MNTIRVSATARARLADALYMAMIILHCSAPQMNNGSQVDSKASLCVTHIGTSEMDHTLSGSPPTLVLRLQEGQLSFPQWRNMLSVFFDRNLHSRQLLLVSKGEDYYYCVPVNYQTATFCALAITEY